MMLMDDEEVVLGSDKEPLLCFRLLFNFGNWFSPFSGEDEWRQTIKRCCIRMYTFGSRSDVWLTMMKLRQDCVSRCSYFVYGECGK